MDAELAPFMRGEFLIFDMRLVRPKMTVSVDADRQGRLGDAAVVAVRSRADFPREADGHRGPGDGPACRERARSPHHRDQHADLGEVARRARGASTVRCGSTACARRSELSTGKVDEKGAMRLRIKADPVIYPVSIETDGDVVFTDGAAGYAGTIRIEARGDTAGDRGQRRRRPRPRKPRPELPAWRMRGSFALDHTRLTLDEFRLETGAADDPYTADGKAYVELGADPRFSVTATGAQVRFDEAVVAGKDAPGLLTLRDRVNAYPEPRRSTCQSRRSRLDRCRPAGCGGRRHHHPRRQDAGQRRPRLAGQGIVGVAAGPHHA